MEVDLHPSGGVVLATDFLEADKLWVQGLGVLKGIYKGFFDGIYRALGV